MSKIRVGVLRGGMSGEYDVSLKTGATVLDSLSRDKYHPVDIFIGRDGKWHVGGMEREEHEALRMVDLVFNALHGDYGEDGKVQQLLESHGMPYTGSGIRASAVGMNKELAKEMAKRSGVKVPYHRMLTCEEYAASEPHDLFRRMPMPAVIKLPASGSSLGISVAKTPAELWEGIAQALDYGDTVMVEQHIRGREATVAVVDDFRGQAQYALMPIEIVRVEPESVWTYDEKYSGRTEERCPGRFTESEKRELEALAVLAHNAIGARHYSRSDFIISPRGIYFLEINTLPGLTRESLVPKALDAGGVTLPQFLDHVIGLALARR